MLNLPVAPHFIFSDASVLQVIQRSFIQSTNFLDQTLFDAKLQRLSELTVRPSCAVHPLVALTVKPPPESLQICKRRSPSNKVAVLNPQNPEVVRVQVEVVVGIIVLANTAAVPSAQEVAAELGGGRDIGDVWVERGVEVRRERLARGLESKEERRH